MERESRSALDSEGVEPSVDHTEEFTQHVQASRLYGRYCSLPIICDEIFACNPHAAESICASLPVAPLAGLPLPWFFLCGGRASGHSLLVAFT